MAQKNGTELEKDDRIVYDYGRGPINFTIIKDPVVMPEESLDEVCLHMTHETEGERLAAVKRNDKFEVPGW